MYYLHIMYEQPIPELWTTNIEKICDKMEVSKHSPDSACFELAILSLAFWGNAYGAYFEQTCLGSHIYKKWFETSAVTTVVRTLVCIGVMLTFFSS